MVWWILGIWFAMSIAFVVGSWWGSTVTRNKMADEFSLWCMDCKEE